MELVKPESPASSEAPQPVGLKLTPIQVQDLAKIQMEFLAAEKQRAVYLRSIVAGLPNFEMFAQYVVSMDLERAMLLLTPPKDG